MTIFEPLPGQKASWVYDLCADLRDARAELAENKEEITALDEIIERLMKSHGIPASLRDAFHRSMDRRRARMEGK